MDSTLVNKLERAGTCVAREERVNKNEISLANRTKKKTTEGRVNVVSEWEMTSKMIKRIENAIDRENIKGDV